METHSPELLYETILGAADNEIHVLLYLCGEKVRRSTHDYFLFLVLPFRSRRPSGLGGGFLRACGFSGSGGPVALRF